MDKIRALTSIGLTEKEASVYLALLDIGKATATQLAEHTKLHRPSVYDILERLVQKGIASHIVEGDTRYFEAADPSSLLSILKEKEEMLQQALPELKLAQKMAVKKGEARVYEGVQAVKSLLLSILELREPIYIYGVPQIASEKMGAFLEKFHRQRIEKKIWMHHIYNTEGKKRVEYLKTIPYCEIRFLPKEFDAPVATLICKDTLILTHWEGGISTIHIRNASIADAYRKYFQLLW
ncbi:hypothetical protein HYS48_02735, partial [Candidatus Woesearchaeota archaeon]|nr:hypothetical protein [Candidatus Woesearchaeota archaeon]